VNSTTLWFDNNPSTFRNWSAGEPDSVDRCVALDPGGFLDADCNSDHMFVCKQLGLFRMRAIVSSTV